MALGIAAMSEARTETELLLQVVGKGEVYFVVTSCAFQSRLTLSRLC